MTSRAAVEGFLAQESLAIVGVSRGGRKFGNIAHRELRARGYRLFPVNANADVVACELCWPSLHSLPEPVGGALIVVPSVETEKVVLEAAEAGIPRIWMQQGAESEEAIRLCTQNGIEVVAGECILMFAQPTAFHHRMHRWAWGLLGKLPQ